MYQAGGKCIFVPFSLSLKFYAGRPLFNLFLQNVVAIISVISIISIISISWDRSIGTFNYYRQNEQT